MSKSIYDYTPLDHERCTAQAATRSGRCRNKRESGFDVCGSHNRLPQAVIKNKIHRTVFSCTAEIKEWLRRAPKEAGLTKDDYLCLLLQREIIRDRSA